MSIWIKRGLLTVAVFLNTGVMFIAYWSGANHMSDGSDIILYLLVLPAAFLLLVWGVATARSTLGAAAAAKADAPAAAPVTTAASSEPGCIAEVASEETREIYQVWHEPHYPGQDLTGLGSPCVKLGATCGSAGLATTLSAPGAGPCRHQRQRPAQSLCLQRRRPAAGRRCAQPCAGHRAAGCFTP